jgi:hypothetical protein
MDHPRNHIEEALVADAKFKSITPIIQDLYINENVPAWLVTSILDDFYDFKIRYVFNDLSLHGTIHGFSP